MLFQRFKFLLSVILYAFIFTSCILEKTNEEVTLSGIVTDSAGTAISDVSVNVELASEKITTQTSLDGNFIIPVAHGGTAYITFKKEGYTPQTVKTAFNDGVFKTINIQMNTLEQDAFFDIDLKWMKVPNKQGMITVHVNTNVSFEVECKEDWISYRQSINSVNIQFKENETESERTAIIKLKGEYGLYFEVTLVQNAGPILRLIDYTGNENRIDFPSKDPFIQFNREVMLVSMESSVEGIDLTPHYSDDKKTISFPKITIPALEEVTFNYVVQSTDGDMINGSFKLKLFEAMTANPGAIKIIFMKDNRSFWVNTNDYWSMSLEQYSTEDLSKKNTLPSEHIYSDFFYNSYNNFLYVLRNYELYSYKIDIYDAATGEFVKQLDLSSDLLVIIQMAFGYNGLGLIIETHNNKIYSIDSGNNHNYMLFTDDLQFFGQHFPYDLPKVDRMNVCNEGKILFLDSYNNNGSFFTVNVDTKEVKVYFDNQSFVSMNYSLPGVLGISNYDKKLTYLNLSTQEILSLPVKYPGGSPAAQLSSDDSSLPWILTSDLSLINLQSGEEMKFEYTSNITLVSSNDGKQIIIFRNDKMFMFQAETFIKYNSKIK